jgi:hypothetical protein
MSNFLLTSFLVVTRYYTYRHVHCVRLAWLESPGLLMRNGNNYQCADPLQALGMPVCCRATANTSVIINNITGQCLFANEATTWAVAKARCEAGGAVMCASNYGGGSTWDRTCAGERRERVCRLLYLLCFAVFGSMLNVSMKRVHSNG